jgi:hypothetical protein
MFQAQPGQEYSEIVLHVKFKENDATLQQETLGNLGVNLVYGAFHLYDNSRKSIMSISILSIEISSYKLLINLLGLSYR